MGGLSLAVGIMDPNKAGAGSSEDTPRIEFEAVYSQDMFKAWVNGVSQSSELADGTDTDQSGFGYGVNVKFNGVSLTASGYSSEGLGHVAGLDHVVGADTNESDGYLLQASYTMGDNRFVISSGETENDDQASKTTHENFALGYFRTVRPGVIMVAEFNRTESSNNVTSVAEDNSTFSIGTVVTF